MDGKTHSLHKFEAKQVISTIATIVVIVALIFLVSKYVGVDNIKSVVDKSGLFGPLVFILFKISTVVFAPISGTPLYLIAEPLFGFTKGAIYSFIGDVIAYSTVFFISRSFGNKVLNATLGSAGLKYAHKIGDRISTPQNLLVTRLVLPGMQDIISYASGLTTISYLKYILVTVPVIVIQIGVIMSVGAALSTSQAILYLAGMVLLGGIIYTLTHRKKSE